MKRFLVLCSMLLTAPAFAGQQWELISITRGPTWEVNQAKGSLKQNGKILEGVLKDKTDGKADYQIRVELNGGRAEADLSVHLRKRPRYETDRFVPERSKADKNTLP